MPKPIPGRNLTEHPPMEDFVMVFSDETASERPSEAMDAFVEELREVGAKYGFDISMWGPRTAVANRLSHDRVTEALKRTLRDIEREDEDTMP